MLKKYKVIKASEISKKHKMITLSVGFLLVIIGLNIPFGINNEFVFIGIKIVDVLIKVAIILLCCVASVLLHECLHALVFKIFTGKAKIGFIKDKTWGWVGYATSPNSVIPKKKLIMTIIAPQILSLILVGILIYSSYSDIVKYVILNIMVMNLAGGCVDYYTIWLLMKEKGNVFVEDTMTGAILYKEEQ